MSTAESFSEYEDAASWACHVYRRSMRAFLGRELRRFQGLTLETAIREGLPVDRRDDFERNLKTANSAENAISYGDFPHLLFRYRSQIFRGYFSANHDSLWPPTKIRDFRNNVIEHGDASVLTLEKTIEEMIVIADFLAVSNDTESRDQILPKCEELRSPNITLVESEATTIVPVDLPTDDSSETASEGYADGLLPPGIYEMDLEYVHRGVGKGSNSPYFGLRFKNPTTEHTVWRNFSLLPSARHILLWFMEYFGVDTRGVEEAQDDQDALIRVHSRLMRLVDRKFTLEISTGAFRNEPRNEVRRWFGAGDEPGQGPDIAESDDDLPF